MLAFSRLIMIGFIILTVIYLVLYVSARHEKRHSLKNAWDMGKAGDDAPDPDLYIERGMREYERSLQRKLILGVYVVPMSVVSIIIYLTNFH